MIGSDNSLSHGRRQAIIWTNDGILSIGPLRKNFSEILIEVHTFSFKKIHMKMSFGKWRPFCLGLNVAGCGKMYTRGLSGNNGSEQANNKNLNHMYHIILEIIARDLSNMQPLLIGRSYHLRRVIYYMCHIQRGVIYHMYVWWETLQTWRRYHMETFSALLALCEGNPPATDGFPS